VTKLPIPWVVKCEHATRKHVAAESFTSNNKVGLPENGIPLNPVIIVIFPIEKTILGVYCILVYSIFGHTQTTA
jgi:hypothetical protein